MPHDFVKFPELRNSDLDVYYWLSPHKQIFEDFTARCVKVIDGDTIRLRWRERDFDFDLRIAKIDAPERGTTRGDASRDWLENLIMDKEVDILIDPDNRVEKWGRLLGEVYFGGQSVGELSMMLGHSKDFLSRHDGIIPPLRTLIPTQREVFD